MAEKINTGGSAFPHPELNCLHPGMTLRDYFAGRALQGLMAKKMLGVDNVQKMKDSYAALSYSVADAMIAEREKSNV